LTKELAKVDSEIKRISKLLAGPFAEKAPPPVVQKERDKLTRLQSGQAELQGRLDAL
jgi:valyl-tRNA synthetase